MHPAKLYCGRYLGRNSCDLNLRGAPKMLVVVLYCSTSSAKSSANLLPRSRDLGPWHPTSCKEVPPPLGDWDYRRLYLHFRSPSDSKKCRGVADLFPGP